MRQFQIALACLAILIGAAPAARAQNPTDSSVLPSARAIPLDAPFLAAPFDVSQETAARHAAELQRWIDDFTAWQDWWARWHNRREPGWFTSSRERRERPLPPAWLPDACAVVIDETGPLMQACGLLAAWRDNDGTSQLGLARVSTVTQEEDTGKSVWWEHIHMDVLWPTLLWRASVYGVVGMHTATTVHGRMQVFTAPGVILLNLPARDGTRVWKFAVNYGIGYRLADFTFPGGRQASLHVNLAKAWMMADIADVATGRSMDFVGLSISFKKTR